MNSSPVLVIEEPINPRRVNEPRYDCEMKVKNSALVLLVSLAALSLAGCSSSLSPSPVESPASGDSSDSSDLGVSMPEGFIDVGTGLAVRWVEPPQCAEDIPCEQIEVYAVERCPSSVYLEANVLDAEERAIGVTSGQLGGLQEGRLGLITFPVKEPGYANLELVEVSCD